MTKDMGSVVSRELEGSIPASGITADGIVRAGRRRMVGRRLGFGGLFLTGAAALTAGILAIQPGSGSLPAASPSASGSAEESPPPAPPQEEQQAFPLPDLDWENDSYDWGYADSTDVETAETAILTERLWQWISDYEGLELLEYDGSGGSEPVTRENFHPFQRTVQKLVEDLAPEPGDFSLGPDAGYERPIYLWAGGASYSSGYAWRFDGADNDAQIGVTIYPKGSYLPGPKSVRSMPSTWDVRHLVAGCEDYRFDSQGRTGKLADFSCEEKDGPDGERILMVECVFNAESEWAQTMVTAVVYQPNGNAVVVDGYAVDGENLPFKTGMGPVLTGEEMADLALSLPDLVVK
ncbi:hypothetical protein [Phytomonospora endophytica]|uniref:Uncharacterized protein n=1 Tax=Phytomonospora endophytica TaxID=714109 RepID=A0A841FKF9_9ACTN|nr:hypothetical protein [Phytomonospora endophytica]MBB6036365.1 hypothetical protein [Phytomonospora endophytica]GIG67271.1 hypothetical protein Pen01_35660 [Phytomonospora endophytica]